MILSAAGLVVDVPSGWDAEIAGNPVVGRPSILHMANVPLPPGRSDFGGHALESFPTTGVFVALLESQASEAGTGLFLRRGKPVVVPGEFSTAKLNKAAPGHVATQRFFTESGRPFCLYAVIASDARLSSGVRSVNQALASITVEPVAPVAD